jgi:UDP-glucose 4-epimerase
VNLNILITRGAGYIGSHASKAVKEVGYIPITLDNLTTGWRDAAEEAVSVGINTLILVTGRNKRAIEDHFDNN